jgi:hypothetical protein
MLIGFVVVTFFIFQIAMRWFVIRLPYLVVAAGVGLLVIFGLGEIMDLPQLAWMIGVVRMHPFEAIVIALATIFVFTVIFFVTVFIACGFPLGVFPPSKDEQHMPRRNLRVHVLGLGALFHRALLLT